MLMEPIYLHKDFHMDQARFVAPFPHLCEYYRIPLFDLTQHAFYTLAVNTFEERALHPKITWKSTGYIFKAEFFEFLLSYP